MKTLSVFFQILIGLGRDRFFFLKRIEWGLGESKPAAHLSHSVGIFSADSWWYVLRALKKNYIQNGADWQWSGMDSGVIFEH